MFFSLRSPSAAESLEASLRLKTNWRSLFASAPSEFQFHRIHHRASVQLPARSRKNHDLLGESPLAIGESTHTSQTTGTCTGTGKLCFCGERKGKKEQVKRTLLFYLFFAGKFRLALQQVSN